MRLASRRKLRQRRPKAESHQSVLQTLFTADSFDDLAQQALANDTLAIGTTFTVTMQLGTFTPFAPAFDLAGAEALFDPPAGLKMIDVRGEGLWTVIVEMLVEDLEALAQGSAKMSIGPAIPLVAAVVVKWGLISLVAIGLLYVLDGIVSKITGEGFLPDLGDVADILKWGAIILIAGGLIYLAAPLVKGRSP